jgi:NTE family protein
MAGKCNIGLVLSGGGARAAYQAGCCWPLRDVA